MESLDTPSDSPTGVPGTPEPSSCAGELAAEATQSTADLPTGQRLPVSALLARVSLLWGVIGLAGLVAWEWNGRLGPVGAELALVSMASCGLFSAVAMVLVGVTAGTSHGFSGLMASIPIRTLGPLAVGVIWQQQHPSWPYNNWMAVLVPLFLVSLTVETILVVDIVSSSGSATSTGKGRAERTTHG